MSRKNRSIRPVSDGVPYAGAIYFIANEALTANDLICPVGGATAVSGVMPRMELLDASAGVPEIVWISKNAVPTGARGIALPWRLLVGQDTSAFSDGDKVYADYVIPGAYVAFAAAGSADQAGTEPLAVGSVLYAHATAGVIMLAPGSTQTPILLLPDSTGIQFGADRDGFVGYFPAPDDALHLSSASTAAGNTKDVRVTSGDAAAGNSGDLVLKPGTASGTRGDIVAEGGLRGATPSTVTNGSANIPVDETVVFINSGGGAYAPVLPTGTTGQILFLVMTVAGNAATIANTKLNVTTSLVFDAVGEGATLVYDGTTSKWNVVGVQGATVS